MLKSILSIKGDIRILNKFIQAKIVHRHVIFLEGPHCFHEEIAG